MRIGPAMWQWVTTDSVGVPVGGVYGNPRLFERKAAVSGLKLAWSRFMGCFFCYSKKNGRIVIEHTFFDPKAMKPLPVTEAHIGLFRKVRSLYPQKPLSQALRGIFAKQKYEQMIQKVQLQEDMRKDVIRATALDEGRVSPNSFGYFPKRRRVANALN